MGRAAYKWPAKALVAMMSAALFAGAGPPDAPVADAAMRGDLEAVQALVRAAGATTP